LPSEKPARRLREILDNIERVSTYVAEQDPVSFELDTLRRDAAERCIERISEAAKKLGATAELLMPEQEWHAIRAVGNVLRHMYDEVDPAVVWRIATDDLPRLERSVRRTLARLAEDGADEPD
jgi:uncharacterized protein with HEPN domain